MPRKFTPYDQRHGAGHVLWLIDELWEQQEQRTRTDWPSMVTHIDTAREKRRGR